MVGANISPEHQIHQWRQIGIVSGSPVEVVMPMVQLRCANENAQETNRQPDVGVDVNRPDASKGNYSCDGFERKSYNKDG